MTNEKIRPLKSGSQKKSASLHPSSSYNAISQVREQLEADHVDTDGTLKTDIPTELKVKMQVNRVANATRRIAFNALIVVLGLVLVGEFSYLALQGLALVNASNHAPVAAEALPAEITAELNAAQVAGPPPVETIPSPPDPFIPEPTDESVDTKTARLFSPCFLKSSTANFLTAMFLGDCPSSP